MAGNELEGFAGQKNKTPQALWLTIAIAVILAFVGFLAQGIVLVVIAIIYQGILQYGRKNTNSTFAWATFQDVLRAFLFIVPLISAMINGLWLVAGGFFVAFMINTFLN